MPRGIYDRTKTKAQRAAEKKAPAAAPTGAKRGPKKGWKKAKAAAAASTGSSNKVSHGKDDTFVLMNEIRSNINTLAGAASVFGPTPALKAETDSQVALLTNLRERLEDTKEEDEEPTGNGASTMPVQMAQTSVPLPPPVSVPVPPVPTH